MDSAEMAPGFVSVDRGLLQQLVVKLLQRKGMFVAEAEIVAKRMIESDLLQRSQDGVGSLPEYLDAMDLGDIDPRARIITISETSVIAVLDGSTGMGHMAASKGAAMASERAAAAGISMVVIRNCRPCGDLGRIASLVAQPGLLGLVASSFDDSETADAHRVAWAYTAPGGASTVVHRESSQQLSPGFSTLLAVLSSGLAGASPTPRKRKPARAANIVEYGILACQPEKFGSDSIATWAASAGAAPVDLESPTQVPLPEAVFQQMTELAAKVKLALK